MDDPETDAGAAVACARRAQAGWATRPLSARLAVLRGLRRRIAERPETLVAAIGTRFGRTETETLTAEVLPLADACRFLEREARRVLRRRILGRRGRPAWLVGLTGEVRREPLGVVLILVPGNYRLFLAGVQTVQALAAGNAVMIKPAPGAASAVRCLAGLLAEAGVPDDLVQVLGESAAAGRAALASGVDKVVLTGSAATGRAVLADAAPRLTPTVMELSGADAVFVLAGADPGLVADALAWGLGLNGGATCIAPRRVFVHASLAEALAARLAERLAAAPARPVEAAPLAAAGALIAQARAGGGRLLGHAPEPGAGAMRPVAVVATDPELRLLRVDSFAPVQIVVPVADMAEALRLDALCPYALGASVFGPPAAARALAGEIDAGVVTMNDVIAPTVDPRLPFAGRGESGFGATRGAEGLLEMTVPKAVSRRRGRARPHYAPARANDAALFRAVLGLLHGRAKLRALRALVGALARRGRDQ